MNYPNALRRANIITAWTSYLDSDYRLRPTANIIDKLITQKEKDEQLQEFHEVYLALESH